MSEVTPGPRAPEPGEFERLSELVDGVFRARGGSMFRDYPRLLSERNRLNLRVMVEGDRIVSHAGVVVRDASLEGVAARVALLGSVATAPDRRDRGYARACVLAALGRAVECGAEVAWISGDRGLYRRLGARPVGDDLEFRLGPEELATFARDGVEVRSLSAKDVLRAAELYSAEAVRFIRPIEDWRTSMESGFAFDGPAEVHGIWDSGRMAAYVAVRRAEADGGALVIEYAGARGVVLAALGDVLERSGATYLRLHLPRHDRTLHSRLAAAGLEGLPAATSGTALVLSFRSLMGRLRGRFLERAGEAAASQLSFDEEGPPLGADNLFRIACGPDVVRVEGRGALAEFLFGTPGCHDGTAAPGAACVMLWGASSAFRAALPVPGLWYGLNFV